MIYFVLHMNLSRLRDTASVTAAALIATGIDQHASPAEAARRGDGVVQLARCSSLDGVRQVASKADFVHLCSEGATLRLPRDREENYGGQLCNGVLAPFSGITNRFFGDGWEWRGKMLAGNCGINFFGSDSASDGARQPSLDFGLGSMRASGGVRNAAPFVLARRGTRSGGARSGGTRIISASAELIAPARQPPTLRIFYGRGCGYENLATRLAFRLRRTFGQQANVVAEPSSRSAASPDEDEAFEVYLDRVLLHSKLTRSEYGDARCESEEEIAVLVAKICGALGIDGAAPVSC